LVGALRDWRKTEDSTHALPAGMIVFSLINAGFESGMVAAWTASSVA
jgi:hypothetical protein